jgi:hypothetical protein
MARERSVLVILLLVLAGSACKEGSSGGTDLNPFTKRSPYVGDWISIGNMTQVLSISQEGEAFVVQDGTRKKFVGTMTNGALRVASPLGSIEILHMASSDHLIAAGDEYRRMNEAEAAALAKRVNITQARRETMKRMRDIATAWEARATDMNEYTVGDVSSGSVSTDALVAVLMPTYIRDVPRTDGWNNEFLFAVSDNGQGYSVRSLGENGAHDPAAPGPNETPNADIEFANGRFVSYPGGAQ